MKKIFETLFVFKLPVLFIVLTYAVGENHPFSKYAMFSSTSSSADYYFLTDSNDSEVFDFSCFGLRTDEIGAWINAAAIQQKTDVNNTTLLKPISAKFLQVLVNKNLSNPHLKNIGELKLFRHVINLTNGKITEQDILLASKNLK